MPTGFSNTEVSALSAGTGAESYIGHALWSWHQQASRCSYTNSIHVAEILFFDSV